ncbi:SMAD/FHA domain-containing protein [Russula dissimulans]|nr:SMAD/FHA domain-containing protein [Russula dissimulans]
MGDGEGTAIETEMETAVDTRAGPTKVRRTVIDRGGKGTTATANVAIEATVHKMMSTVSANANATAGSAIPTSAGGALRGVALHALVDPVRIPAKPNFAPSGLLAAATNTVKHADGTSTLLKYNEPPEAREPLVGWRLYVFKGDEQVDLLHIHRQSAYLVGRDRTVTDIPLEHPSCSKQHAVIQYRLVQDKNEFGESKGVKASPSSAPRYLCSSWHRLGLFVIDLESTNGTHVNGEVIPTSRYYELKASDELVIERHTDISVMLGSSLSDSLSYVVVDGTFAPVLRMPDLFCF